ncbi:MAG: sigma-54-dependent Fis family transcriptional regulator [Deltaproteobacteria bacterium]|nr:sigma-54-dependent Fis family transcriptional regulator [Deltaproteobacteria bacterium]
MKKTILIIDDEPDIRQSMSDIFRDEGYNVIAAEDGSQALSLLEKETPDLMFLDIWLPDSDGLKLLPGLKKEHPQVPVIMISGHGTIETAVQATKMGAFDFIEKPLSLDKLVITASNALTISHLKEENLRLKEKYNENRLIGNCKNITQLKEQIRIIAPTDGWALIIGEDGTGKELVAREIHRLSSRHESPFISVNCAAIPENLIESDLFGYEKGAFSGADRRQKGKFEQSHEGTIFLDEIGELSLGTQARILQVLQEKTFTRLGSSNTIPINVRIIAATNKDLEEEIARGNFRQDLFYCLNVLPIQVPPLRERSEDIPILAENFLCSYHNNHGGAVKHLAPEVISQLKKYHWPGNVRELKNLMERLSIMSASELVQISDLPPYLRSGAQAADTIPSAAWQNLLRCDSLAEAVKDFEKLYITSKLNASDWNIAKAATIIGTTRRNLRRKITTLGIAQTD